MSKPLHNSREARRTLERNLTPRYRTLDSLQAYVEGRQYEGLPSWFDDRAPLLKRAPCIIEPIVESAIESYQDLIFGEGRFPKIGATPEEDDQAFDERFGLNEQDSVALEHLIRAAFKQANVAEVSREALAKAMGERTAVGIACVRDGRLAVDLEPAKGCTPTFDETRPDEIVALEIRYPYLEIYWDGHEKCWAERCMLYRRVVDAQSDTTFQPIKAHESGEPPAAGEWQPQRVVDHRLGFCPVVWYAYRKITSTRRDADGISIHERFTDEIDGLNRTLSQRHRGGLYAGDPQIIETGVTKNENPGTSGEISEPMRAFVDEAGGLVESPAVRAQNADWRTGGGGGGSGRKKGPGTVWRFESKDAKVAYLTLDPQALKPLDDEIDRLRSLLSEGMSWVRPLEAGSANSKVNISRLSGKTLSLLYKRQTSQCDTIRPDVWTGWLYPLANLLLRIILAFAQEPSRGALFLGGMDKAVKLLDRFDAEIPSGGKRWFKPILTPHWGQYFEPDEQDQLATSQQLAQDHQSGFITTKTAVTKLAAFYGIENVDAYLETLTKEVEERKQEESDRTIDEAKALHAATKPADSFGD